MPTLLEIGIDIYGDTSRFDAVLNGLGARAQNLGGRAGASFGSSFGVGFANPILNAVSGINAAIGGIQTIANLALDVSGMRTNAQFNFYRRQLMGIAGDAGIAKKAFKGFVDIANNSNFDTDQVMAFGLRQAGKSGDVAGAVAVTQQTIDAAAAIGVENSLFDKFQKNMGDIESRHGRKMTIPDMTQMIKYAPQLNSAAGKVLGLSAPDSFAKMAKMSGDEMVKLVRDIGKANAGLAQKQSGSDPLAVGANIVDSLKSGLEPTGGIFNSLVTPVMLGIKGMTDGFGNLNAATGGVLGLVGILVGGTVALRYFGGAAFTAIGATRGLTAALLQMAGSAEIAAGANKTAAVSNVGGAIGGAAGAIGGAAGLTGLARTFGMLGRVVSFVKMIGPGLIATAAALGFSAIGDHYYNQAGASTRQRSFGAGMSAAGMGIGIGAGIGGVFGGPLGILIGGVIGAFGGWMTGIIREKMKQNKDAADKKADASQDRHTRAMEQHAEALKTSSKIIGGGSQANTSLSIIEREWSAYALRGVG